MLEKYRVAAQLVASRVVLSSTELVSLSEEHRHNYFRMWRTGLLKFIDVSEESITFIWGGGRSKIKKKTSKQGSKQEPRISEFRAYWQFTQM
jgi:hypothetical protein